MLKSKFISLFLSCVLIASIGGAFAAWRFTYKDSQDVGDSWDIELSEFTWAPEEILPTETPGENYMVLLESLLNNNKGGLNSSKGTLEKAVVNNNLVHCSQNVQGGNLKHMFITEETKLLDFMVQYVSAKEFHVYMYEKLDADAGEVGATKIKVYKTILVETNGEWDGEESQVGYATVRLFKNTAERSILPEEWVKGKLPQ